MACIEDIPYCPLYSESESGELHLFSRVGYQHHMLNHNYSIVNSCASSHMHFSKDEMTDPIPYAVQVKVGDSAIYSQKHRIFKGIVVQEDGSTSELC